MLRVDTHEDVSILSFIYSKKLFNSASLYVRLFPSRCNYMFKNVILSTTAVIVKEIMFIHNVCPRIMFRF